MAGVNKQVCKSCRKLLGDYDEWDKADDWLWKTYDEIRCPVVHKHLTRLEKPEHCNYILEHEVLNENE